MVAVDPVPVTVRDVPGGSGVLCSQVLATLPSWFGIEEANRHYAEVAERSPAVVASAGGDDIGLLVMVRHSRFSAEIHLMAVHPEWHRHGVGRQLLERAERILAGDGVEFLQVKTLSDRHPDAGYEKTRAFYLAGGFRPLEEFPTLWDAANPVLQLVKVLRAAESDPPPTAGGVHHVELWVPNLHRAAKSWGWLLRALGYEPFQHWPGGRSWRLGDHYVVIEQSEALSATAHDRLSPGMNHIAFHAGTCDDLDALLVDVTDNGWKLLFADRHPFAGGEHHYAAYLEDPDGFEVELVAVTAT
jgi:GNAT superfamily N-acetyltransferase